MCTLWQVRVYQPFFVAAEINVHFTDMIDKVAFIWKLTQLGQREHWSIMCRQCVCSLLWLVWIGPPNKHLLCYVSAHSQSKTTSCTRGKEPCSNLQSVCVPYMYLHCVYACACVSRSQSLVEFCLLWALWPTFIVCLSRLIIIISKHRAS